MSRSLPMILVRMRWRRLRPDGQRTCRAGARRSRPPRGPRAGAASPRDGLRSRQRDGTPRHPTMRRPRGGPRADCRRTGRVGATRLPRRSRRGLGASGAARRLARPSPLPSRLRSRPGRRRSCRSRATRLPCRCRRRNPPRHPAAVRIRAARRDGRRLVRRWPARVPWASPLPSAGRVGVALATRIRAGDTAPATRSRRSGTPIGATSRAAGGGFWAGDVGPSRRRRGGPRLIVPSGSVSLAGPGRRGT